MKILLDTNIVTPENIKLLKNPKIKSLIINNKLSFYLSFEMLVQRFFPMQFKRPEEYNDLLNDLFEICDERIFTGIKQLLPKELHYKDRRGKYWFCNLVEGRNLKYNLLKKRTDNSIKDVERLPNLKKMGRKMNIGINSELLNSDLIKIKKKGHSPYIIDDWESTLGELCEGFPYYLKSIQPYINEEIKKYQSEEKRILYKHCVESVLRIWSARTTIIKLLGKTEEEFINWFYNRDNFPYLTRYIEADVFQSTDNIVGEHTGFDQDAEHDNVYICLMHNLDILLSNDTRYMKKCFKYVYGKSKIIMTMEEFLALVEKLSI